MAVTENQLISREDGIVGGGPVKAAKKLLQGTLAFIDAGYLTDETNAGANKLAGVVREQADNTDGADGDINANVFERGTFSFPAGSLTLASVGTKAYASDNYTVTNSATGNTYIGTIVGIEGDKVRVALDVQAV